MDRRSIGLELLVLPTLRREGAPGSAAAFSQARSVGENDAGHAPLWTRFVRILWRASVVAPVVITNYLNLNCIFIYDTKFLVIN